MTVFQLQAAASLGTKRIDEDNHCDVIPLWEIKHKADELLAASVKHELSSEMVSKKTAALMWACFRLAAMYGSNLDQALNERAAANFPGSIKPVPLKTDKGFKPKGYR